MYRGLRSEIQRLLLFVAFCALIGWLTGYIVPCLLIGGVLYAAFLLRQMQRFYLWLARCNGDQADPVPPHSSGVWGDISDAIWRMLRAQERQQQHLQQQLKRMKDSTAALQDGVVVLDRRGLLTFWNDAAGELLGLQRNIDEQQIFGNLFRDVQFAQYEQEGVYSEPFTLHSPIKNNLWLEIQVNVFGNNEKLLVVRNVTRLHQLEKIRSDFVANVSHELRTPLTVLKGYVETLGDNREQLPARWHQALDHMQQQAQRMQQLIDDLTLLTQLENHRHEPLKQAVAVDKMAVRLCEDARRLSPLHHIESQGSALTLLGSESELHSIFSNLITNAVRYSPAGSTVQVRWGEDKNGVFFSVADEGMGIAAAHIPRLTERFYRVDAGRGRADGGTGLGLAIVKHALARHKGTLEIHSTLGQGSVFSCRFPHNSSLERG